MRLTTIKAGLACSECCVIAWGGEQWFTGKLGIVCVSCRDGEFDKAPPFQYSLRSGRMTIATLHGDKGDGTLPKGQTG